MRPARWLTRNSSRRALAVNAALEAIDGFFVLQPGGERSNVHEPIADKQHQSRPVIYVAPPQEQIEKLARAVCRKLGEHQGENYCDTATVQGFTSFLKTVVSIQVKARNAGGTHVSQKAG